MGYIYIAGAVFFTVYGNLVMKWRVLQAGTAPAGLSENVVFVAGLLLNPWILSCLAAGFLVFACWSLALSKFSLSYAYQFMSLPFVIIPVLSALFFHESVTPSRALGIVLVVAGIVIGCRG